MYFLELAEVSSAAQNVSGRALEGHNLQVNFFWFNFSPANGMLLKFSEYCR
uniref:Uncharacterized protein n=1 Tax=Ciona savignyi TaxID=51511 RepID=H2Z3I7_CIOSA